MTVTLLLHCPDRPGIIADITNFITENRGNVVYLAQFVDHVENVFNMRIEWNIDEFLIPKEKISDYFGTLYAKKYDMNFRLYFSDTKPRMAIFVSKMSHCLFDLLARYSAGEWNVEIPLIVSNHPDMKHVADMFGIPVSTLQNTEGPALGAAILAGVGTGVFSDIPTACSSLLKEGEPLMPDMDRHNRYQPFFELYQSLYPALKDCFHQLNQL